MYIASETDNVFEFYRPHVPLKNFKTDHLKFIITREQLILQLNTAPRLPQKVDKTTPIIINRMNETTKNETSPNKNETTNRNKVSREQV